MKTRALQPARIAWAADGTPSAPDFGDAYHGQAGAAAQAQHVFLAGNGLPGRWAGRADFVIAETGFGLGNNFIATWAAWEQDPARCERLHYVAIEAHPPAAADLARAHGGSAHPALARALQAAWPPAVPGLHRLDFDHGRVQLTLALGEVQALLPELVFTADALYLDGFAPRSNPAMWDRRVIQALARRARPDATAATWCVARSLRDALTSAGFDSQRVPGIGGKFEVLRAQRTRSFGVPAAPASPASPAPEARRAIVVGAGLAGACTAAALQAQGFAVEVLDRHAEPAGGASGNPAGLFHATLHRDDSPYARLFRAAALRTARWLQSPDLAAVPHGRSGLLRLETQQDLAAMAALIEDQGLPPDFVQAWPAERASAAAGVPLPAPAWFYADGGWLAPAALVRACLARPGVRFRGSAAVAALRREGDDWCCLDEGGRVLARAPHLVLANADQLGPLLAGIAAGDAAAPGLPLQRSRGQVSRFAAGPGEAATPLALPVAGDGYALPLPDGGVLCGATHQDGDDDPQLREADHRANFERLQRLTGLQPPIDPTRWAGRVGWRVQAPDRLPIAGPVPLSLLAPLPPGTRTDQARLLPRVPGLHLACAFGGRGITLAPLIGELVAARLAGSPSPLEQSLVDLVDPGRFLVRRVRRAASQVQSTNPLQG